MTVSSRIIIYNNNNNDYVESGVGEKKIMRVDIVCIYLYTLCKQSRWLSEFSKGENSKDVHGTQYRIHMVYSSSDNQLYALKKEREDVVAMKML